MSKTITVRIPIENIQQGIKWDNEAEVREARTAGYNQGFEAAVASLAKDQFLTMLSWIIQVKARLEERSVNPRVKADRRMEAAIMLAKLDAAHDILVDRRIDPALFVTLLNKEAPEETS
jgi:flagellar biosynthesis/type III secretory pathway protein FliH